MYAHLVNNFKNILHFIFSFLIVFNFDVETSQLLIDIVVSTGIFIMYYFLTNSIIGIGTLTTVSFILNGALCLFWNHLLAKAY